MSDMDATDTRQQQEINNLAELATANAATDKAQDDKLNDLKLKDQRHDTYLSILNAIIMLLVVGMFLNWFVLFLVLCKVAPK